MSGCRTRLAAILLGVLLFGAALAVVFVYMTAVIVRDPHDQVARAFFTSGEREHELWKLPGGLFIGLPDFDASVEIVCRNGARHRWGYVTPWMSGRYRVEPGCRLSGY